MGNSTLVLRRNFEEGKKFLDATDRSSNLNEPQTALVENQNCRLSEHEGFEHIKLYGLLCHEL